MKLIHTKPQGHSNENTSLGLNSTGKSSLEAKIGQIVKTTQTIPDH